MPSISADKATHAAMWCARIAVAASFLSAVADRLGWWGPPGAPNVAWGDWPSFVGYTASLNPWVPAHAVSLVAAAVTLAEALLALLLLTGIRLREASLGSAILLLSFATAMTVFSSPKAALDYSVLSAAAAALLCWASTMRPQP